MNNPFETIVDKLEKIESLLQNFQSSTIAQSQSKDSNQDELITRKEAAVILGISLPTLHDYTTRGVIPAYRIGSRVRFKKVEIIDCLQKVQTKKFRG